MTTEIELIQDVVAAHYRMTRELLLSRQRKPRICHPRQMAQALAYELTNASMPKVGAAFGGMDHTTIINSRDSVERRCREDITVAYDWNLLSTEITLKLKRLERHKIAASRRTRRDLCMRDPAYRIDRLVSRFGWGKARQVLESRGWTFEGHYDRTRGVRILAMPEKIKREELEAA